MSDKSDNQTKEKTSSSSIPVPKTGRSGDEKKEEGVENYSPSASPRDKRQRTVSETSLDGARSHSPPLVVAASPTKYVSMEEITKAAAGVSNMVLAHEIAIDNDFKISPRDPPENSMARQVRDTMRRAFWDALQEKLREDPPDLSHVIVLLQEVKQHLQDLLMPQHQSVKRQIDEVLDMELIEQKADHGALDIHYYADFVIGLMAKLCAPARDEQIAKLKEIKEIVPLYKEVFSVLEVLRMDMANFTLQQMRPYIQQQSAQYERLKFNDFLAKQKESDVDGLQFTKSWLERNYLTIYKMQKEQSRKTSETGASNSDNPQLEGATAGNAGEKVRVSPVSVLNEAYLELLQWDFDHQVFPETVLMDEGRLISLGQRVKWLCLVSGVQLVTYSTVGGPLAGIAGFKEKLRDNMAAILAGLPEGHLSEGMASVAAQVLKQVLTTLSEHGFPPLDAARVDMLRGQIEALADPAHSVLVVMRGRVFGFLRLVLLTSQPQKVQIPPGLSAVSQELSELCGGFVRLIRHNQNVFGPRYAEIIQELMKKEWPE